MSTATSISNQDDTIDSRDVIARIEELESTVGQLDAEEVREFYSLLDLRDEVAQYSSDWEYGETLIRDDYFTTYIEELIGDCYEMPDGLKSGEWPYRHMKLDYVAAAEEAKQDYTVVDFDGTAYWIRSA